SDVCSSDLGGNVREARDYYPFGLQMPGRVYVQGSETREGFTGHELDQETGMYYAGARYYMPALGRWTAVDPLADEFPSWSPYNYVMNNPLSLKDPDGRNPIAAAGGAALADLVYQAANYYASHGSLEGMTVGFGSDYSINLTETAAASGSAFLGVGIAHQLGKFASASRILLGNPNIRNTVLPLLEDVVGAGAAD